MENKIKNKMLIIAAMTMVFKISGMGNEELGLARSYSPKQDEWDISAQDETVNDSSSMLEEEIPIVGDEQGRYLCGYAGCDKSFTTPTDVRRHRLIHTAKKNFLCTAPGCSRAFTRNDFLTKHMKIHAKEIVPEEEKEFPCPVTDCPKSFALKRRLREHVLTHENEKSFKCNFCDSRFSRSNNLGAHMKTCKGKIQQVNSSGDLNGN